MHYQNQGVKVTFSITCLILFWGNNAVRMAFNLTFPTKFFQSHLFFLFFSLRWKTRVSETERTHVPIREAHRIRDHPLQTDPATHRRLPGWLCMFKGSGKKRRNIEQEKRCTLNSGWIVKKKVKPLLLSMRNRNVSYLSSMEKWNLTSVNFSLTGL